MHQSNRISCDQLASK
jgi:outer membrane protein, heavy metal efflux system